MRIMTGVCEKWRTAIAVSLLIHLFTFAVVGTAWTWETAHGAKEPIYMEVALADLFAPVKPIGEMPGSTGGGGTPVGEAGGTSGATDSHLPNPNAILGAGIGEYSKGTGGGVGGGTGSGGGGTGGSGGGTGGGHGTGYGTGIGPGNGSGSGVTRGPRVVDGEKPDYPVSARANGWEGTVRLQILVSAKGRVEDVRIASGSGFAELDAAARQAVQKWRFSPALQNGSPVAAWAVLPVVFDLR